MQLRRGRGRGGAGGGIAAVQECGPRGSHVVGPPGELRLLAHQLGLEVLLIGQDVSRPLGDCLLLTDPDFLRNLESKAWIERSRPALPSLPRLFPGTSGPKAPQPPGPSPAPYPAHGGFTTPAFFGMA